MSRSLVLAVLRCLSWFLLVVLLAPLALAAHCSSLEFSTSLPSPTRAEPGRQSAEWGGDAFLSSSKAGGRVRSEGEAQPAQAQAPPLELNVGHHLCAEQAGGWGLTLPEIGRYLSPEPLGLMGGLSPFGYAANDPVQFVDPDGLMWFRSHTGNIRGSRDEEKRHAKATNSETPSSDLHEAVRRALPNETHESWKPGNCAEPRALSDHLKAHQERIGRELDPDNDDDKKEIRKALSTFGGQAYDDNGSRAPCANCSQTYANLMATYGEPKPKNIAKGALDANNRDIITNFNPPKKNLSGSFSSYEEAMDYYTRNQIPR